MAQNIRRFRANFGFRHYFLSRVHLKCFGILPNCSFGCSDPALVVNIIIVPFRSVHSGFAENVLGYP